MNFTEQFIFTFIHPFFNFELEKFPSNYGFSYTLSPLFLEWAVRYFSSKIPPKIPACVGDYKMEIVLLKEINTLPVSWSKFHRTESETLTLTLYLLWLWSFS